MEKVKVSQVEAVPLLQRMGVFDEFPSAHIYIPFSTDLRVTVFPAKDDVTSVRVLTGVNALRPSL